MGGTAAAWAQGPAHLLLARRLPPALLDGHLQPQVIPAADPLLLFGRRWQAGEGAESESRADTAGPAPPRPSPTQTRRRKIKMGRGQCVGWADTGSGVTGGGRAGRGGWGSLGLTPGSSARGRGGESLGCDERGLHHQEERQGICFTYPASRLILSGDV